MSSNVGSLISRWLPAVIAGLLVGAGYVLAIAAMGSPQCCDALAYHTEADSIVAGTPALLPVHNYGYAGFLSLLDVIGLRTELGIALAQTTLLYASVFTAAFAIGKSNRSPVSLAMAWLAGVALVPAAAWAGLTFSEGLAAPVLFLALALAITAISRLFRHDTGWTAWAVVVAWGLVCGLAWMVRPGLVWIPVAMGFILLVLCIYLAWRGHRGALLLPLGFAVGVMLVALPQFQYGDPFKADLAELQSAQGRLVFRYATEIIGTDVAGVVFTPLPQGGEWDPAITARRASGSRAWQVTAMLAHVVTGWDARPSPAYVYADTGNRWLWVSALSGFLIVGVLCSLLILWQRRPHWMQPDTYTLGALVFAFALSQGAVAMTSAEFRFNLAGWVIAGCCLAMVSALGWWTRRRAAIAFVMALLVSAGILLFGQLTLMYSERWLQYAGLLG